MKWSRFIAGLSMACLLINPMMNEMTVYAAETATDIGVFETAYETETETAIEIETEEPEETEVETVAAKETETWVETSEAENNGESENSEHTVPVIQNEETEIQIEEMTDGVQMYEAESRAVTYGENYKIMNEIYGFTDANIKVVDTSNKDVTDELIDCLNQCRNLKQPMMIYLPKGNYTLSNSSPLNLYDHVYLVTENDTVLTKTGTSSDTIIRVSGRSDFGVCGGIWDCANKAQRAFYYADSDEGLLMRAKMKRATQNGMGISNSTSISIQNVTISDNKEYGITVNNHSIVQCSNLTVDNNQQHGMGVYSGAHVTINNSTFSNNYYSGISASNDDSYIKVSNTKSIHNGYNPKSTDNGSAGHGIGISDNASGTIINCQLLSNHECGLSVFGEAQATVSGCTIKSNLRHGIGSRQKIKLTLNGKNVIEQNGYNGVLVSDRSTAILNGTTIKKSAQYGLSVCDKSTVTLNKTTISGSKKNNITLSIGSEKLTGSKVIMQSGNCIDSAAWNGISVNSTSSLTVTGTGNTVKNNKQSGIVLDNASAQLTGLSIYGNTDSGVKIRNKSSLSMTKCTLTNNKKYGLSVYKATVSKLTNNTFSNPSAKSEVYLSSAKGKVVSLAVVKINQVKKTTTKISGKGTAKLKAVITIGSKNYKATVSKKGSYSAKIKKAAKGTTIKVATTDKYGNVVYTKTTVK